MIVIYATASTSLIYLCCAYYLNEDTQVIRTRKVNLQYLKTDFQTLLPSFL
jgi:hypothetical protein